MTNRAEAFARAFVAAYREARASLDDAEWSAVWDDTSKWNWFVLWGPRSPVVERAASRVGLEYYQRELFQFDGVFTRREPQHVGVYRFPLAGVVEHENDIRGFEVEIAKLCHIRCPLKVGITYVLQPPPAGRDAAGWRERVMEWATLHSEQANREIRESPETEYCLLVGVQTAVRELQWWTLCFNAEQGAADAKWCVVDAG